MKKKILLLALFLGIFISGCKNDIDKSELTINVYNWGEYISNGADGSVNVNAEFTKETGINVNYTTFQSNEELFAKLSGGGANYDVIIPSDYMISKLIQNDMLQKLDFNNIPNSKMIDEKFLNPEYDPKNEYSIPYTWGVFGVLFNTKMVDEDKSKIGWDILWSDKYKGKILMFDNSRDSFAISHIRLGHSINSNNLNDWYMAAEELKKQKPLVQAYVMDQIFDKMGNDEAAAAPYYAGDSAVIMENNPNIDFVIPREGTNRFVDAMCIPKGAAHKQAAEKYINFMCRKDIALANVLHTGYSTPHKEVYDMLDDEIKYNPIFYPNDEIMEKTQVFVNLPNNINETLDDLWIQVKVGGTSNGILLIVVMGLFVLLYIGVVVYKRIKSNNKID